MSDILEILQDDYRRFPVDQTYDIYAENVYFKDPMNEFRGIKRYREMIGFMSTWFQDIRMDLHSIDRNGDRIDTRWTLHWTTPLPWRPRIAIPGRSELTLDASDRIISHIDYWDISKPDVIAQHFRFSPRTERRDSGV
ncbi:DUF2358 domain-containing protein [Pannus brasiliensis CCIBt3594]|uniref:DUF2358 domain-containing protein n=1 Tax=Pannus brasiliensis CCIBt3594 TaxID=1427578 RepID=A0AAW9QZA1_9CHRO